MSDRERGIAGAITRLKELDSRAAPAPWSARGVRVEASGETICRCEGDEAGACAELIASARSELGELLEFAEKAMVVAEAANTLLANAFSDPSDESGIRFKSEDAVKLQWALRTAGSGDDSEEASFSV